MFQALSITTDQDGTPKANWLITVMGDLTEKGGVIGYAKPDGLYISIGPFVDLSYRPYALQRLGNPGR